MFYVESDSLVSQFFHEVSLPVPLQTGRIKAIEHALQHRKRHGSEKFEGRTPEAPQRTQNLIRLFQRSVVAPDHAAHLLKVQGFRERWPGRDSKKCKEAVDLFRGVGDELAIPLHDIRRLIQAPQHRAGTNRLNWMCLEQKRSHYAEVPAPSADGPE